MTNRNSIPEALVQLVRNRDCVPFIGTGFSVAAGLPSAADVPHTLSGEIGYSLGPDAAFDRVTEIYAQIKGEVALRKRIAAMLADEHVRLKRGHRIFGDLVRSRYFQEIVITNYDHVIEKSVTSSKSLRSLVSDSPLPFVTSSDTQLIKYHS